MATTLHAHDATLTSTKADLQAMRDEYEHREEGKDGQIKKSKTVKEKADSEMQSQKEKSDAAVLAANKLENDTTAHWLADGESQVDGYLGGAETSPSGERL